MFRFLCLSSVFLANEFSIHMLRRGGQGVLYEPLYYSGVSYLFLASSCDSHILVSYITRHTKYGILKLFHILQLVQIRNLK